MAQIDDFFMYENRVEGITNTYDHEKHPFFCFQMLNNTPS